MDSISRAREKVWIQENRRPAPGQRSRYWEDGRWWVEDFHNLLRCEAARDAELKARIAASPAGSDAAARQLAEWSSTLDERADWYRWLDQTLRPKLQNAPRDSRDRSVVVQELYDHSALVAMRLRICATHEGVIGVTYLEHRRRPLGRLKRGEWRDAWRELCGALDAEAETHHRLYAKGLPAARREAHSAALREILALQQATQRAWAASGGGDQLSLWLDSMRVRWRLGDVGGMAQALGGIRAIAVGSAAVALLCVLMFALLGTQPKRTISSQTSHTAQPAATRPAAPAPTAAAPPATTAPSQAAPLAAGPPPGVTDEAYARDQEGMQRLQSGDCAAAVAAFNAAIAAAPDWAMPYNNRAFCNYELGEIALARATWETALEIDPSSADARAGLAMARYQLGDIEGARDAYAEALRLDPRYADADWMRRERMWSERAISDSAPLRAQ